MADRVVELFADLSIRGGDAFDQQLRSSKQGLEQMGQAADDSSEQVRQAAIKQVNAYERVQTEVDKAAQARRKAAQTAKDAVEREKLATDRLADAQKKYGDLSPEVIRAQKRVSDAHKDTERAARAAEKATDQYTVKQKQAANAAQKAAQEIRRAGDEIDTAMPSGKNLDGFMGKLGSLGEKGSEFGGNLGGGFMAGFAPKIASLGSKGGPIGAALAGVATVGLAAGALLARSVADGAKRGQDQNEVQAQLGIDDATAGRLGKAASEAYMGNFGESVKSNMESIGTAIQSGLLAPTAGQGDMQHMSEQLSTLATVMKVDIPEAARAAGQMVKTGMADNATEAFDILTAASQKGLNISGDLLDTMNEYGTQFRKVGLDGADAMGLISQAVQNGARDTDVAADAIKEFSLRVTDGSESTSTALQGLGLNVQDITAQLAQGGEPAKQGLDQILDKLREMPPSVEKNQIAAALFGTQWEDLGAAFDHFDLSTARKELGDTEGALDMASKKLSEGPGAAAEQARRTVEEATMGIKQTLADAFGPAAQDMAQGLLENKDEIASFFADLVVAALDFGIAMGNTAAGALHVWGEAANGLGTMIGGLVELAGTGIGVMGNLISKIPGMGDIGNTMRDAGDKAKETGTSMKSMGDGAHAAANFIADQLNPAMANARDKVAAAGDAARNSSAGMDTLRNSIVGVPDGKSVVITDNSPEARKRLEDLGFTVTTMPDGSVYVEAKTADAQARLDQLQREGTKWINVKLKAEQTAYAQRVIAALEANQTAITSISPNADGSIRQFADGGVDGPLPDQAVIQNARNGKRGLIQWAEADAGPWEAYIPGAQSKRPRATAILSEVADRFGYRLASYADGGIAEGYGLPAGTSIGYGGSGFPDWITQLGASYNVKPSTYAGHQESDRGEAGYAPNPQGLNRGIDWSGSVDDMQRFAEAMMVAAPNDPAIEQVIWMNPNTGQKLGWHGRSPDTDGSYFASDYGGHTDHVHLRVNSRVGANAGSSGASGADQPIIDVTLSPESSREDVARKIIAEGKRRGYNDAEIKAILATAIQESNLSPSAQGGGGAWHGVFQQDGSYPGRDDPNTNITGFYDRLDQKKRSQGWSTDPYRNIFWLQQRPGELSADAAVANGRQGYLSEIQSRAGEADSMFSSVGPVGGPPTPEGYGQTFTVSPDGTVTNTTAATGPPEDPYTTEVTFDNPLEPFWWKGEKEYRQRIIDEEEKRKAWDEYWDKAGQTSSDSKSKTDGTGTGTAKKGKKLPTLEEAEADLRDAQESLKIAEQRQRELKPDAKESSKMSAQRAVTKANEAVTEAKSVIEQVKANPSGYLPAAPEVKKFAFGDVRNGHQPEMVRPGDFRMWGEPESGGESYIPHAPDRRARAIDIWAKTGRILGVKGFAAGGFGGYTADTRDASAPKNLYDLLSLGVGGGMMLANAASPYAMSFLTGKWDLGNLTPQFDTKANSNSDVTQLVGGAVGQISSQLTEIIWALKEGENITVKIDGVTAPANLSMTRKGW
ncbi:phage tail tape measure protein [Gordonia sp. OPL2]|uniref:phage tail tape measure protein n=1 Tax=Gordonia sp. OPL2 TaxID=2486274 RepID=UPI0016563BA0|nr:phage tail tape measure protein [Gordonia sp. OPL2]ROZ89015.1 hypothetical protein EEB19_20110 [Gordonia sp. OPL2]